MSETCALSVHFMSGTCWSYFKGKIICQEFNFADEITLLTQTKKKLYNSIYFNAI